MLAGTGLSRPTHSRLLPFADLLVAGWSALGAVALAGLTLGFFAWYALIVPRHHGAVSEFGLIASVVAGVLVAVAAWIGYSRYFSRRAGITFVRSLQYDGLTWLPFLLLWCTFVLAPQLTHGARLFSGRAHLGLRRESPHRGSIQSDRPRSPDRFCGNPRCDHRHRRTRFRYHRTARRNARTGILARSSRGLGTMGRRPLSRHCDPRIPGHGHGILSALSPADTNRRDRSRAIISSPVCSSPTPHFSSGLLYLYKLLEHEYDRAVARRAIFYVSIFPDGSSISRPSTRNRSSSC